MTWIHGTSQSASYLIHEWVSLYRLFSARPWSAHGRNSANIKQKIFPTTKQCRYLLSKKVWFWHILSKFKNKNRHCSGIVDNGFISLTIYGTSSFANFLPVQKIKNILWRCALSQFLTINIPTSIYQWRPTHTRTLNFRTGKWALGIVRYDQAPPETRWGNVNILLSLCNVVHRNCVIQWHSVIKSKLFPLW